MAKKSPPPSSFVGHNVQQCRLASGLTQLQLAHAIGYKGQDAGAYISRIESGKQQPRVDTLAKIAEALHTSLDSLLKRKPVKA